MTAKELFEAGKLAAAIDQLNQDVKANPRDPRNRIFLFELLCFLGDFDRAERQLDAIAQLSGEVSVEIGTQVYKNILDAEKSRLRFFQTGGQPKFLSKAPAYASLHLEAIIKLRENRPADVEKLLEESESSRMKVKGIVDGKPFSEFRDCDDLLAPFLEVIVQKDYIWLPFEHIKQIEIPVPKRLRELIWVPAKVELRDGVLGEVFLPGQYCGSSEDPNDMVKLGRMTDWKPLGEEFISGVGQRIFLIDGEEKAILEIRQVQYED